jgi:hypothetical protein
VVDVGALFRRTGDAHADHFAEDGVGLVREPLNKTRTLLNQKRPTGFEKVRTEQCPAGCRPFGAPDGVPRYCRKDTGSSLSLSAQPLGGGRAVPRPGRQGGINLRWAKVLGRGIAKGIVP